jgi:hypothetical protein
MEVEGNPHLNPLVGLLDFLHSAPTVVILSKAKDLVTSALTRQSRNQTGKKMKNRKPKTGNAKPAN